MKIITKYILASSLVSILIIALFGGMSLNRYQDNEVREEHEKLETCIRTFWELLSHKGTDFRIVDGQLLAGTYPVNGNFELPDKVQNIFGGVATIFMGDERVTTNVLNAEGKRALGTRLTGPAHDAVFRQGKSYRGLVDILGVSYLTAYDPIKNKQGEIIGVLFVGVKESEFLERLDVLKKHLIVTLAGMTTVFMALMVMLGRAIHRVEEANQNQIRFQQTLINTIPSPLFYKDANCRYLGCNQAFETYVGFSQDELIGKTPHELWPDDLADRYLKQDLELIENPGMQSYETVVRYADGTLRDVIFNKATFEEKDGAVAGLVGVILDITERKAAEEETKNAYQQLWDIVEFLPDATFVVDNDKRVIAWNRAIEDLSGLKKEDVIGQGDYAYALPFYGVRRPILIDLLDESVEEIRQNYTFIKVEGKTLYAETYLQNFRNRGECYLWGVATPLYDQHGKRVGGIESIRDITAHRCAEQEKSRLEAELHHARMMEVFMIRMGHDLKTPLTPLMALLPLLRERVSEPDLKRMLDICCKSSGLINELTQKTGMLVTLASGAEVRDYEETRLYDVVENCLAACSSMPACRDAGFLNEIDPDITIKAVPRQIHELFSNLLSNAVRYSPEKAYVRFSAVEDAENVTLTVADQGIGLAPEHLEKVFEEFYKADESRHDLDAAGLGLSICRRIVQNHNGWIRAESDGPGHGTRIVFTLQKYPADPLQHKG